MVIPPPVKLGRGNNIGIPGSPHEERYRDGRGADGLGVILETGVIIIKCGVSLGEAHDRAKSWPLTITPRSFFGSGEESFSCSL